MVRLIAATEYASDAFEDNVVMLDVLENGTTRYLILNSKGEETAQSFIPWQGRGSHAHA